MNPYRTAPPAVYRGRSWTRHLGPLLAGAMLGLLALVTVLVFGCTPSASTAARQTANVVHAVGEVAGSVLDTCTVVLARDAAAPHDTPAGVQGPLVLTTEEHAAAIRACDEVARLYEVIRTTHAALVAAIRVAEASAEPNWSEVSRLVAEAFSATEQARQAVDVARTALR